MIPITITAQQRDILYEQLTIRLSGIDAVWLAFKEGDLAKTERLGREFSDSLRLVLDDLRLGEGTGEPLELTTPPDVLRRVFERLSRAAEAQDEVDAQALTEAARQRQHNQLVLETCQMVLRRIDAGQGR